MEFKIARDELSKALYRAQGIVERKTTMPMLSNVLLEASREQGLVVSAFDTEIGLQSTSRCEILKDGSLALPGRYFYDIVKSLPDQSVHLKRMPNGQVEVVSGNARFKIVSTPAKDFPPLPTATGASFFSIAADDLALMIERTQFAISADETRYNLGGVFLEQVEPGSIRMVATDGHRLSMIDRKLASPIVLERGIILPKKGLMELRRLLSEDAGPCELALTPGSAVFRREGILMIIRLLEGIFPDYRQVIPKESSRTLILKRHSLTETLRRVSLVAQDKASGVRLEVGDGCLILSSQNPDLGEAQEQIDAKVTGSPLKVGFNARYLIDVMTVLTSDEVQLDLLDDLSPGLLKPVGETGYLAVVMPMRIEEMADDLAVRLVQLAVAGFRNLGDQELEPHPRFTLISGANGQGKTNLLEAIHYALTLRMLRPGKLRELIAHGSAEASVQVNLSVAGIDTRVGVRLEAQSASVGRELRRERTPATVDEYLLAGSVVAFTPDDLSLIRGGPERRRRMLDRAIFNRWPGYLGEARAYQRLLKSRNQLIRQRSADDVRESFETQLWTSGARILKRRRDLLGELSPLVVDAFERIGLGHGKVRMHYRSLERGREMGSEGEVPEADLARALRAEAEARLTLDQERGFTSVGPHADDLNFTLAGRPARSFASQGQARALVLAVKVAEIENLRSRLGHAPVLLLDDVSSELDPARNVSLLAYLRDLPSQVMLTTTDDGPLRASVGPESDRWVVTQGIVKIE